MKDRIRESDTRPDPDEAFNWLQGWYMAHCDDDWEHSFGVTIETIDNPGWNGPNRPGGHGTSHAPLQAAPQGLSRR